MREKDFLFKLGVILVPAVFASSSFDQILWIAFGSVLLLVAVPIFEGAGFRQDFLQVSAAALLAALADETARRFGVQAGVFFPVILVNVGLCFRREALQVRVKAALWFVFGLLVLGVFKDPFFIFSAVGCFLFAAGLALKRKWVVL